MTTKRFLLLGAVLSVALLVRPADATPLLPGSSVIPSTFTVSPGTLIATTGSIQFTSTLGASDFSGTVTANVYREAGGTLDFVYQFHNNVGSQQPIEQMSDSAFGAFMTDVQLDTTTAFDSFTSGGV